MFEKVPRHERLEAFLDFDWVKKKGKGFWEQLRFVYTDSEGTGTDKDIWLLLFQGKWPNREKLMDSKELKYLEKLPDEIPIFRGCPSNKTSGISWTTEEAKALWFAERYNFKVKKPPFDKDCVVVSGVIAKSDILAVFLNRNEFEIVVDPKKVKRKKQTTIKPKK